LTDTGFHAKEGNPSNMKPGTLWVKRHTFHVRLGIETVLGDVDHCVIRCSAS
jgi:hypothetical protein